MRIQNLVPLLLLAPLTALAAAPARAQDPFLDLSVTDVYVRAAETDQLVLLFFTREDDPDTRRMRSVLGDPEIQRWMKENVLAVAVDVDQARKDASSFGVAITPVLILTESDRARVLERVDGVIAASDLLTTLELSIAGRLPSAKPEGELAQDPYAWLAYANHVFRSRGSASECAAAYFWVLDNADGHTPGLRARLFEFVLKRIAYLKQATPDAVEGLLARRNEARRRVVTAEGGAQWVYELVRFDYWLRRELDTLETLTLLTGMGEAQLENQRTLLRHVLKLACDHRHYDLILQLVADPVGEVRTRLAAYRAQEQDPSIGLPDVVPGLPDSRKQIVQDASDFYEALLSAGRGADAESLAQMVFEAVPTGRAYTLFMTKAERLGLHKIVDRTGQQGLEKLGPHGQSMVRTAQMRIENERKRAAGSSPAPSDGGEDDDGDR